jgi:uncharacterized protein (DUF4415 family)
LEVFVIKASKKPEPKPATLEPISMESLFEKPQKSQPKFVPPRLRAKRVQEVQEEESSQELPKDLGNLSLEPEDFIASGKNITLPEENSEEEFRRAFANEESSTNVEVESEHEEQTKSPSKTQDPKATPEPSVKESRKKKVGRPAKHNPAENVKLKEDGIIVNIFLTLLENKRRKEKIISYLDQNFSSGMWHEFPMVSCI